MKKIFQLTALAILVLPLMFACKHKNEPSDPENWREFDSKEDWLEYWTSGDEEDAVDITVNNISGTWKLYAEAYVPEDNLENMSIDIPEDNIHEAYVVIKSDLSFAEYHVNGVQLDIEGTKHLDRAVGRKKSGTWKLEGKRMYVKIHNNITGEPNDAKYKVVRLEKGLMAVTYDREDGYVSYIILRRIDALPSIPPTFEERMTKNSWFIITDTLQENGKIVETNKKKAWEITFAPQQKLIIKDANDKVYNYEWFGYDYEAWLTNYVSCHYFVRIDDSTLGGDNPLKLPQSMEFYPDFTNGEKAMMNGVELSKGYYIVWHLRAL